MRHICFVSNDVQFSQVAGISVDRIMHEYEIGCEFRDKLVPNALNWFTGRAAKEEEAAEESEEEDIDDRPTRVH